MQPINNRQNGRRRGRNNNQRPQSGGGQSRGSGDSGNRIDSRSRGNAAQLLEKYKNMAREAQMAGDRVQTEYYLQFADHYFRVLADSRARQEEQRPSRQDDRYDDRDGIDEGAPFGFGDEGEMGEPGDDSREPVRDRDHGRDRDRNQGREQGRNQNRDRDQGRDQGRDADRDSDRNRPRRDRAERGEQRERLETPNTEHGSDRSQAERSKDSERDVERDERPVRREGLRPRRRPFGEQDGDNAPAAIDVAVLPPAIGIPASAPDADAPDDDAPPPRRRAARARKPVADEGVTAES